jgi:L-threonylcarbamoyladenylate synthase
LSNIKRESVNGKNNKAKGKRQKTAFIGFNIKSLDSFDIVKIYKNEEYAKNLFSFFRECDTKRIKIIYCQRVKDSGVGVAIMNRLKKAINN